MGSASRGVPPRLFLDSGVLLEGLFSPWSASHALLILARCGKFKIVLAEYVRREVERNLVALLPVNASLATEAIEDYSKLIRLLRPETRELPTPKEIADHRHLIRHQADVAVLVSALKAAPDMLLTTNTRHFTQLVARRTGLRIATPHALIERLAVSF